MVLQTVEIMKNEIPFEEESVFLSEESKAGLVLVDIINGFCTVGSGNLVSLSKIFYCIGIAPEKSVCSSS